MLRGISCNLLHYRNLLITLLKRSNEYPYILVFIAKGGKSDSNIIILLLLLRLLSESLIHAVEKKVLPSISLSNGRVATAAKKVATMMRKLFFIILKQTRLCPRNLSDRLLLWIFKNKLRKK